MDWQEFLSGFKNESLNQMLRDILYDMNQLEVLKTEISRHWLPFNTISGIEERGELIAHALLDVQMERLLS